MFPYSNPLKSSTFAFLAKNYDLISSIPYPCKLLDFGCSSGKTTKMMANFSNITEILGLDQHSDIVAVAECFNSNRRVSFDVADLEDFHSLPKPSENRFNLVTSFFSLDEFENVEEVLHNIYKCLHHYGYLIGKLFGQKTKAHMDMEEWIAKNRLKIKEIVPNNGHFNSLWTTSKDPALEIRGLLEKCEFEKVQCEYIKENIIMNKEEIKEYLQLIRLQYYKFKSEDDRISFYDQALNAYLNSCEHLAKEDYLVEFHSVGVVALKPG